MNPYSLIKTLHIVAGSLFFIGSCHALWPLLQKKKDSLLLPLTGYLILPFGFLQLLSGFTLISLQHYPFDQLWIKVSLWGFVWLCVSWVALLLAHYKNRQPNALQRYLSLSILGNLLIMVFFMANRLT